MSIILKVCFTNWDLNVCLIRLFKSFLQESVCVCVCVCVYLPKEDVSIVTAAGCLPGQLDFLLLDS